MIASDTNEAAQYISECGKQWLQVIGVSHVYWYHDLIEIHRLIIGTVYSVKVNRTNLIRTRSLRTAMLAGLRHAYPAETFPSARARPDTRRVNVRLSADTQTKLREIGKGNLTEGIERAAHDYPQNPEKQS